ncbi:hypothetical protein GUA87_06975 [Sneathiella sp. P13V-1]|uniref:hypothetical protein n=1 Tax=Sneathiella sp. P13V-1 TaxID=2697366 RepID=UPI00187B6882|nr:hypothetical protein [Sneathiella sp. P13V-1]MBE7636583.1 hypothetical protein [Sneathiella sp. P13V-1]
MDEIAKLVHEIVNRRRGYANFFGYSGSDKETRKAEELDVGRELLLHLNTLGLEQYSNLSLLDDKEGNEPFPDLQAITQEQKHIGIEITELVNEEKVAQYAKAKNTNQSINPNDWHVYDKGELEFAINEIINKKNEKISRKPDHLQEIWLTIFTDEAFLKYRYVMEFKDTLELVENLFDEIYLVISYSPEVKDNAFPNGYPIIKLK